jgi:GDP-D-mannose dehydratase
MPRHLGTRPGEHRFGWSTSLTATLVTRRCLPLPGIERNFVAASDKVYGAHDDPPHRDSTTFEPRHPYDVSKVATGPAGISYWHTFG